MGVRILGPVLFWTLLGFTIVFRPRNDNFTRYINEPLATWVTATRNSVWEEISQPAVPFAAQGHENKDT